MGWVVNATPRPLYPPRNIRYPFYRRLGGPPGSVWTGAENLIPNTEIRSPNHPARSGSLIPTELPRSVNVRNNALKVYWIQRVVAYFTLLYITSSSFHCWLRRNPLILDASHLYQTGLKETHPESSLYWASLSTVLSNKNYTAEKETLRDKIFLHVSYWFYCEFQIWEKRLLIREVEVTVSSP